MRIVVTGGGTGGHIYPALAIAEAFQADDDTNYIHYIGCKEGLENTIVAGGDLPFDAIDARGIPRRLTPSLFKSIYLNIKGWRQAKALLKKIKPDLIIGTGGFVCGPVIMAGRQLKIPALIHEQNAMPGITNRLLSQYVEGVCLTFTAAEKYFNAAKNIYYTGLPVRSDVSTITKAEGLAFFGLDPLKKTLLVTGGSRGARNLNVAVTAALPSLLAREDLQIIFATGTNDYTDVLLAIEALGISLADMKQLIVRDYIHKMPYALAAADVVIGRAGATFLAEIARRGLPGILVPYPYAAGNHQLANAETLVEAGASSLILDADLSAENIINLLSAYLDDDHFYQNQKEAMAQFSKPQAAENIVAIAKDIVLKN